MGGRLDLDCRFDRQLGDEDTVGDCRHRHRAGQDTSGIGKTDEDTEEEAVDAREMEELSDMDCSELVFDLKILQRVLVSH